MNTFHFEEVKHGIILITREFQAQVPYFFFLLPNKLIKNIFLVRKNPNAIKVVIFGKIPLFDPMTNNMNFSEFQKHLK